MARRLAVDPRRWQREPTVLQQAAAAGVEVVRIGPAFFDGSGLTEAALRGGRFVAADSLDARVDAAVTALRSAPRALVYVYWGDVDKVGHVRGCGSWEWGTSSRPSTSPCAGWWRGCRATRRCTSRPTTAWSTCRTPSGSTWPPSPTCCPASGTWVGRPARRRLYLEPGTAPAVAATWRQRLDGWAGGGASVLLRDEAVAAGWFGEVSPHVLPRIGDVVVACGERGAIVHSGVQRPHCSPSRGCTAR
ncbi:hypothetical protein GCM10025868_05620 [Angustibacter aerolatus]|uniref:Uncharacterized protein n=1 Tax=Angustibacter aerolatus TaxID=1162965 RepID=A0ABQ6JC11_9ACTN|nr:hypothetical protein GCM10025868_05620 [Angustibacter aerolatus]